MGNSTAHPLSRDETVTVLLDALAPYIAATRRAIGIAHAMATVVGGEPLDLLNDAIADYRLRERLVRVTYRALREHQSHGSAATHEK
ncbi:hypothetical protein C5E45_15115 [Nocardia nova]|uniref:Uncharacterized protein n=1 Tax=Nocardia nova TaxID=37330 RepID=A0A2S6AQC7_9NOCA|nr:hypothetical protein [Nocardia nova]PPJ26646.1 hypothetical protein C5E41_17805 [Nocardia nova]PPJ37445.1 hypothetical protein C5E45_15115 [Nocardia nova]